MNEASSTPPPAWDEVALRAPHAQADKAARVEAMFDAIAPTYERVNRVVSFGQDARWRRRAVAAAEVRSSDVVLDVCCGTGDLVRAFAGLNPPPRLVLGLDFAAHMLACGRYDGLPGRWQLLRGDALRLPLQDASVDVVSCAFGIRNFQDLAAGLREFHRVLRPGGRVVILEFALPENPVIRLGYRFYCERLLPILARWISRERSGAYRYLPKSIQTFERRGEMLDRLERAGFPSPTAIPLNLGGVVVYCAQRAAFEPRPGSRSCATAL